MSHAIRVEKILAKKRWPLKDAIPAMKENINMCSVVPTITGNSEMAARYVVIILGLDINTANAFWKAILFSIFFIAINLSFFNNAFWRYLFEKYNNNKPPIMERPWLIIGNLLKIIAAPNKETNDVSITPMPVAKAHEIPAFRPDPIEVAIVFKTLGPGIKTLRIKKPKAGKIKIIEKLIFNKYVKSYHSVLNLKPQFFL